MTPGGYESARPAPGRTATTPHVPAGPAGELTPSLKQATAVVLRAAEVLGLFPQWTDHAAGQHPTTVSCQLLDRQGNVVPDAVGHAAGSAARAGLGAVCEALERHLAGPAGFDPARTRLRYAGELARGALAAEASALLLAAAPEQRLACWTYEPLAEVHELDVPVYLSSPWYADSEQGPALRERAGDQGDYRALSRYAVNSGYGLGLSLTDATLHALYETVERDACSLLLAHAFLGSGHHLAELDPRTLPPDLASLHAHVEESAGHRVHLLDATTDLDIPTVVAYSPPTPESPYFRGQGASLSMRQAVHRALTELLESVQVRALAPGDTLDRQADLRALHSYPQLHACGRFDLTGQLSRAELVPFADRRQPPGGPQHRLDQVLSLLAAGGYTAYRRTIRVLPGDIHVAHALVPGLERFFAVVKGALVLPGPRGRYAVRPATRSRSARTGTNAAIT
ncbi:YcaO-like family protein [Streptomyces sp. NBC_00335]|uniref:YcaO-like family protein n=1 Tax=unclassified Streptomyces TaxID=2593676 RepID=UPI002257F5EB|nr:MULTISPECIES: YcaO-like family protein [unclassified Streptomyces]MCX5404057.1 YcaO-like family protein [Streptomyces sp. NBC_00086]